ncbi:MAG: alpha/beta fold hydrolase, partial [Candidatus Heimdallarchaeota archaeon]
METTEPIYPFTEEQKAAISKLIEQGRRDVPNFYDEGEAEEIFIPVEGGKIRVYHHKPNKITSKRPIIFAPGFGTTPWAWRNFHKSHHGFTEYYHLDTREKASSTVKNSCKVNFTVDRTARDIAEALKYLGLDKRDYVMYGASYVGGVVLKGLIEGYFDPPTTVIFDPLCKWAYAKFMVRWMLPCLPACGLGALRFLFIGIITAGMKNQVQKE